MRLLSYTLVALVVLNARANAGQLPLTTNDISLMLRTGYTSASLMQELSVRHFADSLDDAKEKALTKAGASTELIDALKSGIYSLSADKIAAVQQQLSDQARERAEKAVAAQKSEAAYEAKIARERTARGPTTLGSSGAPNIADFLKGNLTQLHNGAPSRVDDTVFASKKLIAFYFSAEWCGPCRKFTPKLVEYYNRVAPQHPEFEVVFYSRDKSPYAMDKYMRDDNMPWPAIDFDKLKEKAVLSANAGDGIPSLVLVDSNGRVISSSFDGSKYLGPDKVLSDLDAIFAGKPPSPRVAAAQ